MAGERRHHAVQQMTVLARAAAKAVGLACRARLADEGDADRDSIGAERALQRGRVTQLVDGDPDAAVALPGYRPRGQLGAGGMAGLMARRQQRGHGQGRPGRQGQCSGHSWDPASGAYGAAAADDPPGRDVHVHAGDGFLHRGDQFVIVHDRLSCCRSGIRSARSAERAWAICAMTVFGVMPSTSAVRLVSRSSSSRRRPPAVAGPAAAAEPP